MTVYRITLAKYADKLYAPGTAGRWNEQGRFVIYTAGSVSLACLENLVHRSAISLQAAFRVMYINIPPTVSTQEITPGALGPQWEQSLLATRHIGNHWLRSMESCMLKVPSAIIEGEWSFLLNPAHPHFENISLLQSLPFRFDERLKA